MLSFPVILSLLFVSALFFFVEQHYERLAIATTLIGTFAAFPSSNRNVMTITNTSTDLNQYHDADATIDSVVPSMIHQVKLGKMTMRPSWKKARSSCQSLHPDWTFQLWEDERANDFVHQNYPQIYDIYRGYSQEIQRSNVLRYLLLDHFGGVYLDLDLDCHRSLDFLRNESFITPPANPTGVNNAFILSSKGHPFWSHLIDNLPRYNLDWYTPYLTNMFSTGCHFFSTMHRTFPAQSTLRILDSANKLNGHTTTPLFEHLGASSWHKGDAKLILQMGSVIESLKRSHIISYILIGIFVFFLFLAILLGWKQRQRQIHQRRRDSSDMESLKPLLMD